MTFDFLISIPMVLGVILVFTYILLRPAAFSSQLRGPPSPSWLYGNMPQILLPIPYGKFEFKWQKLYGMVYRVKGCFGVEHLMVSDGLALRYIVNNANIFTKPPDIQWVNRFGLGSGSLLTAVDEQHRRLKAAMNPAFSNVQLKKIIPTIQKAASEASRRLAAVCDGNRIHNQVDIFPLLHNITLQAVSESIMGYNVASDEQFAKCYENLVVSISKRDKTALVAGAIIPRFPRWITSLLAFFPPPDLAKLMNHRKLSNEIAQTILDKKLEAIKLGLEPDGDLIGRLVYENMLALNKLTFEEIKDQFGTVNAAGEDTTANALSWALFQLSGNPEWQNELRQEISRYSLFILQDDYDRLPFLNAFIKETLRFHSPVPILARIATTDALLPLSRHITTSAGKMVKEVAVKKGQIVLSAIQSYHRSTATWGEDADCFMPSRWLQNGSQHENGASIGPYANLVTFWGGSRTCIGWRYAILEMQVMLCELIGNFSFDIQDMKDVHPACAITTVPVDSSGKVGLKLVINHL
ncbi:cytochrome P450 [Cyathus striatus]|nr:cytochrome P450 [Cyathus striatus]